MKSIKSDMLLLVLLTGFVWADPSEHMQQRGALTDGTVSLESSGLDFAFSLTSIYQANTKGGISTHRRQGRWSGSYDLEMNADLERLLDIQG
ncbi:MAG TPA: hypothetical protein PLE88_10240, partial [Anaerohalosphaeraceae bacterium]|nr:hypothetical protein [Anaerohalosphaeraceae bacterium]